MHQNSFLSPIDCTWPYILKLRFTCNSDITMKKAKYIKHFTSGEKIASHKNQRIKNKINNKWTLLLTLGLASLVKIVVNNKSNETEVTAAVVIIFCCCLYAFCSHEFWLFCICAMRIVGFDTNWQDKIYKRIQIG